MKTPVVCVFVLAIMAGCKRGAEEPAAPSSSVPPGERAAITVTTAEPDGAEHDVIVVSQEIAEACGVAGESAYFAVDSTQLRPGAEERLDAIAKCLTEGPLAQRAVVLVGHADPRGSESYNEELGQARAYAVFDYLRGQGVSSLKMETVSHGQTEATDNERMWPRQRRVEIQLVAKDSSLAPQGD